MKRFTYICATLLVFLSSTASADDWTVSYGQSLRFVERDFTGGDVIEVTRSFGEDWQLSVGYTTDQVVQARYTDGTYFEVDVEAYAYVNGEYIHRFRPGKFIRPYLAFGVALHEVRQPLLSANFSFASSVGINFGDRLGLKFRHLSNAGFEGPNWGQDVLQIQYTF